MPTSEPTNEPISALSAEGPWLVYVHNSPRPGFADLEEIPPEFVFLNQDGSGRTSMTLSGCYDQVSVFLMQGGEAEGYLAQYGSGLYLFRPSEAAGILVHQDSWYPVCNTFYSGDEKGGLLASFYQASKDVSPELILFELPSGNIRERFPLVRCPEGVDICEQFRSNWGEMMRQQPQWSPNGRYLAFVVVLDAPTSDLFVYDTQDGNLRRLTSGPDWVGPIEWSPDGTQIIMQELLNDFEFFFDPNSKPPTSVWSVSVSTNEIKLLYETGEAFAAQNILRWLDEERFIAHEGFLVGADAARNLRLVDTKAGTNRILYGGMFVMVRFDPVHETFALYVVHSETSPQGIYLVSTKNNTVRRLEEPPYILNPMVWDPETGLFVSEDDCQDDPQSFQAFDHQGNFKCVPKPAPTPAPLETASYPSPDGTWNLSVKDGLWLEAEGKPAVLLSQEIPSDVVWCPDSSCFFYSVVQADQQRTLYRVSLPDLTTETVDEGIESIGGYQWLGDEK
jgi:WD40 repeat protein